MRQLEREGEGESERGERRGGRERRESKVNVTLSSTI